MFDHNSTFNFYQAKLYHTLGFLSKRIDGVFILSSASILLTFVAIQIQKGQNGQKIATFPPERRYERYFYKKFANY